MPCKSKFLNPYHETKYCPHCNSAFECKVDSITQCQCSSVKLNQEERNFVRSKYRN
ncbi:cysteine-rich CWC family protein [Fulvivirga sp. 29W222]|uniref:Cysteine-rich CWC family protein n=1 Tax=Fulvivirga marina TaxID=2494733 RepID=A0A937FVM2_9BACT|nr:cysteine-rich CWC family protein [Fulvivirga marina]